MPIYNISMTLLAAWLSENMETTVLDQTGLAGNYDLVLNRRETEQKAPNPDPLNKWDLDALGLKLVPMKVPSRRLVIDHIERPSAN